MWSRRRFLTKSKTWLKKERGRKYSDPHKILLAYAACSTERCAFACFCLLLDAPSVLEGRDVGVTLGQRGVLECEANAVPEADFEWYKDDRR